MMRKTGLNKNIFSQQKALIGFFLIGLLMLMVPLPAFAHKVNIFAYTEGDTVYTESYFPDGRKVEDGLIEVYDSQGNKLLEGRSDKDGQFNFKLPKKDDLKIVINASMGHKNWYLLSRDELPQTIEQEPQQPESKKSELGGIAQIDSEQLKKIIDTSIDEKLKPIKRLLIKSQQKEVSFTEVIAGIGYIFGIMGIFFYFLSKRKDS
jgi:nickel transport protein